jgi:ornithine lipid hydroxylase
MSLPPVRTVFAWLVFPGLVALLAAATTLLLGTDLPRPLVSAAMLVGSLVVVTVLERASPFHPSWNRRPERLDLVLLVGNRAVDIGVIAGTLGLLAALRDRGVALEAIQIWPTGWPLGAQALLGIGLAEGIRYALHRVSHNPGFAWRIHRTHHEPERLYAFNGPRLHPGNQLWLGFANIVPMLVLGAALEAVVLALVMTAFFVVFQHANVRLPFAGWNQILATPDVHRLHHRRSPVDASVNYGIVLLLFDRLFGTYEPPRCGPAPNEIGLLPVPPS